MNLNEYEEKKKIVASNLIKLYRIYLHQVELDNIERDIYDGDTYMGYEMELSFNDWIEWEFKNE